MYNSVVCMLDTFMLYLRSGLVAFGEPDSTDANINKGQKLNQNTNSIVLSELSVNVTH